MSKKEKLTPEERAAQKEIALKAESILEKKKLNKDYKNLLDSKDVSKNQLKMLGSSNKEISQIQKILDDDDKIRKSIRRVDPDTRKKAPSMTDQLVSALLLLSPQLIGMAVGGAMEGAEGAVAGYKGAVAGGESGMKMMETMQDMEEQELDIQKKQQEVDMGPGSDDLLSSGERLRAEQFMISEKGKGKREGRLQTQGDRRADIQERGHDLREDKMRQFTPAQQKEILTMDGINFILGDMEILLEGRDYDTGEFIGAGKGMALRYGVSNDMEHVALMTKASLLLVEQLRTYSGTAVNEAEVDRWKGILMTEKDRPDIFRTKLKEFRQFINHKMDAYLGIAGFYGGQWGYTRKKQPELESPRATIPKVIPKGISKSPSQRVKDKGLDLSDDEIDARIKKMEQGK